MLDKSKLGNRYTCYECGTKFYDLNRPEPLCPECNANQALAPARDIRSLLAGSGVRRPAEKEPEEAAEPEKAAEAGEAGEAGELAPDIDDEDGIEDEDDFVGLLDDDESDDTPPE